MIIVDKIKIYSKGIVTEDNLVGVTKGEKPVISFDVSHLKIPMEFADYVEEKVKSLKININNINGFLLVEGREI